jgi:hypothetical protein
MDSNIASMYLIQSEEKEEFIAGEMINASKTNNYILKVFLLFRISITH